MTVKTLMYNERVFSNLTSDAAVSFGIPDSVYNEALSNQEWMDIRSKRDGLIEDTDSTYLRHQRELRLGKLVDDADNPTTLSSAQLTELDTYVQALADIPQSYASPDDVVWPKKPSI
ncbi:Phage tail assembly chaperone protein [Vibrio xiamenensis]|uniref:Phage tail assembly chaperone protein n=1 Tax=Vibrio xiamenensis TaxID=861298 RepID=A0A1G8HU41_9VIBR|nr:phage tail assembly chaperone [Vibrio xiamenensis]SDI10193.1 Phage tail assembly chaperone protein [Vibrio xiamenensis]